MDRHTTEQKARRTPVPLDSGKLRELALRYVGRYATSESKLTAYLLRKIWERGWIEGEEIPDITPIIQDFARLGYVNDDDFAASRAAALHRRGYGPRRVRAALQQAGIAAEKIEKTLDVQEDQALQAAIAYAKRRRLGTYARTPTDDPQTLRKWLAAMMRAGHDLEVSRTALLQQ